MWQYDLAGSRANMAETTIGVRDVSRLVLKWAFAFPGADAASSQPAVIGSTVYTGGHDGRFYALDAATGAEKWVFDTTTVTGPIGQNQLRDGPAVVNGTVYFGDSVGYFYALDASSGALRWATRVETYPSKQTNVTRAIFTSSPLVWRGRIFVGVSSNEESSAAFPLYECCVFRGSVVALDAGTGKLIWRHYTVDKPVPAGLNLFAVPRFSPSGAAVWSSPALDARDGTVIVGTGNAYTGNPPGSDAVLALAAATGQLRWLRQMTPRDDWNFSCDLPQAVNCPNPGPDFDFGSSPNVFTLPHGPLPHRHKAGHRRRRAQAARVVVGIGQKSGAYFLLDARTGETIWQRRLMGSTTAGTLTANEGVKWGSSYDGRRIYAAVSSDNPGSLYALDPRTGRTIWDTPNPADGCSAGGGANFRASGDCKLAMPAAVTSSPGLVFEGSLDGKIRAFSSATGRILWQYDTVRTYQAANGIPGTGGSISGAGAVIAHGMMYVNSGYNLLDLPGSGIHGNVLLAFGLPTPGTSVDTSPIEVTRTSPAAAMRACVAAWNATANEQAQGLLRLRRNGRTVLTGAGMFAVGSECLITIRLRISAHRMKTIRLGLIGQRFVPAPSGEALLPPEPRTWNLRVLSDGLVAARG